jgi:thioredoxin-like negative regulator of GroEL
LFARRRSRFWWIPGLWNSEVNPDLAARYRVHGIPAFIVFGNGEIAFQRAGAATRTEMRRWLSLERAPAA